MTPGAITEVGFYHLTRTGPDQALPALLGRTLAAGERAVVRLRDEARVAALDEALWASTDPDSLPHGTARTGHAALQPIWLTTAEENPNGARYLFVLDGLGSRGLTWSALLAEHLVALVEDEPSPLPAVLADAVDPARFAGG